MNKPDTHSQKRGLRVKQARTMRGLSQMELANALGLKSQSMVSMIERGERTPSNGLTIRLANALGVSPAWIFDGSVPPNWLSGITTTAGPELTNHLTAFEKLRQTRRTREKQDLLNHFDRLNREDQILVSELVSALVELPPEQILPIREKIAAALYSARV